MNLNMKAAELRETVVRMIYKAKAGHVGGDMSEMEILISLYYDRLRIDPQNADDPNRDRFVLSKGHSVESLYAVLADRGFFDAKELDTYFQFGTQLIGHPNNKMNGIEMNSGALGHGLSVCVGMALAAKLRNQRYRVYTLMGDGELAEGSIWEAVEAAAQYRLDNLCAILDLNGLQISGTTEQVMAHRNLKARFETYGWNALDVDGHDLTALHAAFDLAERTSESPTVLLAHTVKGKGISFMENNLKWHHKVFNEEEFNQAIQELEQQRKELAQ